MKTVLLSAAILYFLTTVILPGYYFKKRTGINPVVKPTNGSLYDYIGNIFKLVALMLTLNLLVFVFKPSWYQHLYPFTFIEQLEWNTILGFSLFILSWILVIISQKQMAHSWRIGIDTKNSSELITSGIFSISRNPIFLGLQLCLIGLFLIMPNGLMLIVLILGVVCIEVQIRLEEAFLEKRFGKMYLDYKRRVGRWL